MIILLIILAGIVTYLSWWFVKNEFDGKERLFQSLLGVTTGIFGCIFIGFLLIWFSIEIGNVLQTTIIDDKIAMYQEENELIESQIDTLVKEYMEYEQSTYTEFKDENAITLISLYPDLKADELVKQQLEIYSANNQKIKELKEQKLNCSISKWLVYFG